MTQAASSPQVNVLELPPTAPRVRITAGVGSATQKTWNLRRPVTVVGSKRPAHIVLHDHDVSHAHCVIVNTGEAVLVKDLHTKSGTLCNTARIELTELKDGDVLTVGQTKIQVAVQWPEQCEDKEECLDDRTVLVHPLTIRLVHTEQTWTIRESVSLIGRHPSAAVHLDHAEVNQRHAVLFRHGRGVGVFDLNGGRGVALNGKLTTGAILTDGDRLMVGPFGLQMLLPLAACPVLTAVPRPAEPAPPASLAASMMGPLPPVTPPAALGLTGLPAAHDLGLQSHRDPVEEIASLSSKLDALRTQIADSWGRLNAASGPAEKPQEDGPLGKAAVEPGGRDADLERRDAQLRGQLHDIEQYHAQLAEREREIHVQLKHLQEQQKSLMEAEAALTRRDSELNRRSEELARREHAIAQRWSRLQTSICPHCGERLGTPDD
jgi:pSer/pThr/pTyr-binding forkhead associated (FHA) protein